MEIAPSTLHHKEDLNDQEYPLSTVGLLMTIFYQKPQMLYISLLHNIPFNGANPKHYDNHKACQEHIGPNQEVYKDGLQIAACRAGVNTFFLHFVTASVSVQNENYP